jgi:hypothetical protein
MEILAVEMQAKARLLATQALHGSDPEAFALTLSYTTGRKWTREFALLLGGVRGLMADEHAVVIGNELDALAVRIHRLLLCKLASREVVATIDLLAGAEAGVEKSAAVARLSKRQNRLSGEMHELAFELRSGIGHARRLLAEARLLAQRSYVPPNFLANETDSDPQPDPDADPGAPLTAPMRQRVERALAVAEAVASDVPVGA